MNTRSFSSGRRFPQRVNVAARPTSPPLSAEATQAIAHETISSAVPCAWLDLALSAFRPQAMSAGTRSSGGSAGAGSRDGSAERRYSSVTW